MDSPDLAPILAALAHQSRPVVLLDGGSGAGKTELARRLAPALGAQLVSLDDFYPGWDGLEAGSRMVSQLLETGRWQGWDWDAWRPADWHSINLTAPILIEGSGALSRSNRALATYGIWLELDEPTRKHRALARDGEVYARQWDRWARQEREFFERERPDALADLVLSA